MPDPAPQPDQHDEPPKKPVKLRNATHERLGQGLQIIGTDQPLERIQLKPGATAKEIAKALLARAREPGERAAD